MPRDLFADMEPRQSNKGRDLFEAHGVAPQQEMGLWDQFKNYLAKDLEEYRASIPEEQKKRDLDPLGAMVDNWKDLYKQGSQGASDLKNWLYAVPDKASESYDLAKEDPGRAALDIGAGLTSGAKGMLNLPAQLGSWMLEKDPLGKYIAPVVGALQVPDTGLQEAILGEQKPGDELLQLGGSLITPVKAPKIMQGAGKTASKAANVARESVDKLKPSKILRGSLSEEELIKNLEATRGTGTGLGNVIDNPTLKRIEENMLARIPGSGVTKRMQETGKEITRRGHDILNDFTKGKQVEDVGEALHNSLIKSFGETNKLKNQKFGKVNELAGKLDVNTPRFNLRAEAEKMLRDAKNDPDLARFMKAEDLNLLNELANPKSIQVDGVTIPKNFDLKSTDILRGKIGDAAYEAYVAGDKGKMNQFLNLRNALEKDVKQAISQSKSEKLKQLHKDAMDYYKNDYAPFEDNDIQYFLKGKGDSDVLVDKFFKTSKTGDRANLLKKLTDKLSKEDKDLLLYQHFAKAIGDKGLNPTEFAKQFEKIGKRQRELLFDKDTLNKLENYQRLARKNSEALNVMFNPPTGQRGLELMSAILAGQAGLLPEAAMAALASRGAGKLLGSEKVRERLVKKMLEENKKKPINLQTNDDVARLLGSAQVATNKDDR